MSSQLTGIVSLIETRPAVPVQPAMAEKPHAPSQFKMARLIRDLEGLLLLKNAEPYHKFWQKLKLEMSKSLKMTHIIVDNIHITKLINMIKIMINK